MKGDLKKMVADPILLQDESDNRILECATVGKADVIITGDKEMLKLGSYKGIKIITLKDYLAMR